MKLFGLATILHPFLSLFDSSSFSNSNASLLNLNNLEDKQFLVKSTIVQQTTHVEFFAKGDEQFYLEFQTKMVTIRNTLAEENYKAFGQVIDVSESYRPEFDGKVFLIIIRSTNPDHVQEFLRAIEKVFPKTN